MKTIHRRKRKFNEKTREETMTKFGNLILSGGLAIGLATILGSPVHAAAPGPSTTGLCAALDQTCGALDTKFAATSVKVSNSHGITSTTCTGATTNKPKKAVHCLGETLGGTSGETTTPPQACVMTLGGSSVSTDDWTEVITPSGTVSLVCRFGGSDAK
jgi:hypothetical protein